jgi:large subunit ribosomal protein L1
MAKLTKKQKALQGKADSTKLYPIAEALVIVKEAATAKLTNPSTWPCNWA